VNASGQVVGWSSTAGGEGHAFSWTRAGGMVDLGTLGGSTAAFAVSDSGQVVGSDVDDQGFYEAFSWTQAGGMVSLDTLGGIDSIAGAVNESGQIVGSAELASGEDHAVLWLPGLDVANAGVEQDPAEDFLYRPDDVGFHGTADVRFAWSTEAAHGGDHSLVMTGSTSSSAGRWMTRTKSIDVTPGVTYEACAWFEPQLARSGATRLAVDYWDERPNGSLVYLEATRQSPALTGTQPWTQLCVTTSAPAKADHLRVEARFSGKGSVWLDDFSVVPLGP
jgi:probable HAF family extracellular repeat protein